MMLNFEIVNWDKFNYRKDVKSATWFRMQNDFPISETCYHLSIEGKWLIVCLLSISSKKGSGRIITSIEYLSHFSGVTRNRIKSALQILETIGFIRPRTDAIAYARTLPATCSTDRQTNERTDRQPTISSFNFDVVYQNYPKKIGKKKGLEKLKRIIKTEQDYKNLEKALKNYTTHLDNENAELKYVKQFSTFVNCYDDWIDYEVEVQESPDEFFERELENLITESVGDPDKCFTPVDS